MEIWTAIPGYDGFYEVSNYGNVRSLTRSVPYGRYVGMVYKGRDIKLCISNTYLSVKLSRAGITKTMYIHDASLENRKLMETTNT
jgi:hypothetical protein